MLGYSLEVGAWNVELFSPSSVNAKLLAQPVLQAGPSRCESGHGCQFVRVAQIDLERHRAKVEAAGATPAADAILKKAHWQ